MNAPVNLVDRKENAPVADQSAVAAKSPASANVLGGLISAQASTGLDNPGISQLLHRAAQQAVEHSQKYITLGSELVERANVGAVRALTPDNQPSPAAYLFELVFGGTRELRYVPAEQVEQNRALSALVQSNLASRLEDPAAQNAANITTVEKIRSDIEQATGATHNTTAPGRPVSSIAYSY